MADQLVCANFQHQPIQAQAQRDEFRSEGRIPDHCKVFAMIRTEATVQPAQLSRAQPMQTKRQGHAHAREQRQKWNKPTNAWVLTRWVHVCSSKAVAVPRYQAMSSGQNTRTCRPTSAPGATSRAASSLHKTLHLLSYFRPCRGQRYTPSFRPWRLTRRRSSVVSDQQGDDIFFNLHATVNMGVRGVPPAGNPVRVSLAPPLQRVICAFKGQGRHHGASSPVKE